MPSDSASYINRRSIHLSSRPPRFRPHRAPVNPELTRERIRAHPLRAGCSHSVHFLVREPCSRSSLWFRRCANQRVVGLPEPPRRVRRLGTLGRLESCQGTHTSGIRLS